MEVLELPQFTIIEQRLVTREVVFTTGELFLPSHTIAWGIKALL